MTKHPFLFLRIRSENREPRHHPTKETRQQLHIHSGSWELSKGRGPSILPPSFPLPPPSLPLYLKALCVLQAAHSNPTSMWAASGAASPR